MPETSAHQITTVIVKRTIRRIRIPKSSPVFSKRERDMAFEDFFDTRFRERHFKSSLKEKGGNDAAR